MNINRNDLRKVNVIFVHSEIDDLGLSVHEFRIYAHIARRAGDGECFPSIPSIAKHCKCSVDTARETIHNLIQYKLIDREERPGNSPLYRLTSVAEWKRELVGTFESKRNTRKRTPKTPTPPDIEEGLFTPPDIREGYGHRGGDPSGHRGGDPSGHRGDEVHPTKVIHLKGIQGSTNGKTFHTEFIDGWCREFQSKFGFKYDFLKGKDGAAVKKLSSLNMTATELLAIVSKAWNHPKHFIAESASTICGFSGRMNEIRVAVQRSQQSEVRPWDGYADLNALEAAGK